MRRFPYCMTDGGVRKAYKDIIENFSPDLAHLNVKGQAAEAELDLAGGGEAARPLTGRGRPRDPFRSGIVAR